MGGRDRRPFFAVALVMDEDELLPLLTMAEAQGVVGVLAAVVAGQRVDGEVAGRLLSELAARVPSREVPMRGGLPEDPVQLALIQAMGTRPPRP
ncbi:MULTISPECIES: hypothetical protein [unclassified Streptomyces]|uniref:hypothetical protein n=1 Tax=unclassified Streptomyces TaxID=2593676 RepID=UPI00136F0D70|nr:MULTISPECIES: hypothetical protein [unclassified Streptomyces]NDZ98551.1 hypothetical protein [Streptomyces sp. SID10116]MYY79723.1 hypothetical protein [Streptomyces sp. SID335]MYZ12803.1 hypothetical protein [Streptomyces sp. SID337]NDZ84540.1 hypothetical protein [Streptomyces sp. SID10115]NEB43504.1 hypothetical protein [Streptomyces sp. SID339]